MKGERIYFVYRVFDAGDQLLYIGCTNRPTKRWSEHKTSRPGMVAATARCRVQGPYTRVMARAIEKAAISTEEPLLGWTPTRHREKCARDRWIDNQTKVHLALGRDGYASAHQAVLDAREWFPDPYEHEAVYRGVVPA